MPGLSSLKVNIKDQPHNLAWINEDEQALLKDLGGSGRPGPMGIPAYPMIVIPVVIPKTMMKSEWHFSEAG